MLFVVLDCNLIGVYYLYRVIDTSPLLITFNVIVKTALPFIAHQESSLVLKYIEKDLREIHNEVTYNSGSSLKDAVRRIEDYQKVNHKRIETIEEFLTSKEK